MLLHYKAQLFLIITLS